MPRKRTELERADKVDEIVEAAERQLASGGYGALSMKGIAGELGLAQAAVYWYFPTKDHLFVRVVERRFLDAWSRKPKRATLTGQVQWFADEVAALQPSIVVLRQRAEASEVAAAFVADVEAQLVRILGDALDGESVADPRAVAEAMLALVEGLAVRGVTTRKRRRIVATVLASLTS